MRVRFAATLGARLRKRQHWLLVALLGVLHLALLAGGSSAIGLTCWLVDVGLFLLWQPFIRAERRLDSGGLAVIALIVGGGAWLFGWWLLIFWVAVLAALVGGRVMFIDHRPTRVFHLLAFAYLVATLLLWLLPRVVPEAAHAGPSLERELGWGALPLFCAMLLLPYREEDSPAGVLVDFFYSLFIFLLIAVLVLGSLAFMLLRASPYVEAVFYTLISMAAMLLVLGWAWNPRPGFSGVGVFFSRYLLTIGLPFEEWLHRLTAHAERESDPDKFLLRALESMLELPLVEGGEWGASVGATVKRGRFGHEARFRQEFPGQPLQLLLYTRYQLSPALLWHFHLLSQLTGEYYVAKLRARELQQVSYLRAVHETGARLTHDVKNLLQSLNNLCYLAQTTGEDDAGRLNQLLQRQLPQITQRLQQTLDKLQKPTGEIQTSVPATAWWAALRQRYGDAPVVFEPVVFAADAGVPAGLFDGVADNLLQNALAKLRQERPFGGGERATVSVALADDASVLRVCDGGSPVAAAVLADLLQAPVVSENGLGIGLYHAARQAEEHGYRLRLASNVAGQVCFELRREALGRASA
ncbi:MAG: ATP-binding protein [Candidatus Accumulibacter sp.]|nr:ATP-binding protein [Accumulibacter sp.]MBA4093914.1 ATP-binding protein [Accumulibacter sp.]